MGAHALSAAVTLKASKAAGDYHGSVLGIHHCGLRARTIPGMHHGHDFLASSVRLAPQVPDVGGSQKKRTQLLKDIRKMTDSLGAVDFILFSGDITNSGAKEEFDEVRTQLIDPIRTQLGAVIPIYCVPGNHDIQRGDIDHIAAPLKNEIASLTSADAWRKFNDTVYDPATATELNKPLSNYFDFLDGLGCRLSRSKLHSVQTIEKHGIKAGLMCINTAWNSARFNLQHIEPTPGAKPWLWDYGLLRITEAQLQNAIDELGAVDLGILTMHHPLHWIDDFERAKLEHVLFNSCHIVIHGHEHRPNTSRISSAFGDLVFIPAGATYAAASPEDPSYTSAYNFATVDTEKFFGTVHHRIWAEEVGRWQADERFWMDGQSEFLLPKKKDYDLKLAHKANINANKQYIRSLERRAIKEYEITISHDAETVSGESFIKQRVKISLLLREGPAEDFLWLTGIDEMIAEHPNKEVRKRAFNKLKVSGGMVRVGSEDDDKCRFSSSCTIDRKEQRLEYEYEKLELPSNCYLFQLSRFADRIKLRVKQAKGYRYSYVPLGGFPAGELVEDKLLSIYTLETTEMTLPSQGCLIQWRPEHKAAVKPKPYAVNKRQRSKVVSRTHRYA